MDDDVSFLLSAAIVFVGAHILLSHPLRAPVTAVIGERLFMGAYSLVALFSFGWMIYAFIDAPRGAPLWNGGALAPWIAASVLSLIALLLFLGSLVRNPALPHPEAQAIAAARDPTGVFRITRHPMMWGFALWALSHIIVSPNARTIIFAGSLGFLALFGSTLQDRKKNRQMGAAWEGWVRRTHYWPRYKHLLEVDWKLWAGALVLWLAISWSHLWFGNIPAGIWRWV